MADVSVEFGAKDTGLEQTLKTVQNELNKLNAQVKSGELSFEELQKTMKQVAQAERLQSQLQSLGNTAQNAGQKTMRAAGIFDESFKKIAAAFTVGNIAAQGFQKIVNLAFTGAQKVVQGFSEAIDLGGRLDDLGKRTGETAGRLLVLENAFREAGVSADQVGTVINKLQGFMVDAANGGERQAATMSRLGISLDQLRGKTPTEQMGVFAKAIAGIEDPTQRAAAASDVFGEKLGGRLLPLLMEFSPALDKSRESVGSLEQIMDESAAKFAAAGDTIDRVRGKFAAFAAGILSETIPAFDNFSNKLEKFDAAGFGEIIGKLTNPILSDFAIALNTAGAVFSKFNQGIEKISGAIQIVNQRFDGLSEKITLLSPLVTGALGPLNPLSAALRAVADSASEAAQNQTKTGVAAKEVGASIKSTLPLIGDFNANLQELEPSFTGVSEQATIIKGDFSEMATLSAQLVGLANQQSESLGGVVQQTQLSKQLNEEVLPTVERINQLLEERAAREAERGAKMQEQLQLDLQIAQAKASGNESLLQSLEYQKLFNQYLQQAIDAKMGEEEAKAFAKAMADAKTAAGGAANNLEEVKSFVDLIAESKPDEPIKKLSEKTADARREIEAFGEYIGEDLGRMSFPDIAKKLGVDTLGMTGSEQIDAIVKHIQGELPKAKEGIVDEKESTDAVAATAKKAGEELKQALDYAIDTGQGGKVLGSIEGIVKTISEIVAVIRDRLPQQALA